MLESVVKIFDHAVGAGVGLLVALGPPDTPKDSNKIYQIPDARLRFHCGASVLSAAHRCRPVPVQQVRNDFVCVARTSMSDTGGLIAVEYIATEFRLFAMASHHRIALALEADCRSLTTHEGVHDRRRAMDRNRIPRQHKAMKKISDVIGQHRNVLH